MSEHDELLKALEEIEWTPPDELTSPRESVPRPEPRRTDGREHTYVDDGFRCPTCEKQDVWLRGKGWTCASCKQRGYITFFRDRPSKIERTSASDR